MKTILCFLPLVLVAALAGCGGGTETGSSGHAGISIDQALDDDGRAVVNGNLLVLGGEARLCDALAESFPPQCGGASIIVRGLDLDSVDGLTTEGEVTWSDRPIQVEGVVAHDVLVVDENAPE